MLRHDEPGSRRRSRRSGHDALTPAPTAFAALNREIEACDRCPRLVVYRQNIAREKRRAFANWDYWGKPLAGFGDPRARILIVGLAPAAHGGNRTGRVFTGDRSGDWLFAALHRFGFANQPTSEHRDDGLVLRDVLVTAAARCAPPDNKPTADEFAECRPYLQREMALLANLRVVIALGKLAFDAYVASRRDGATIKRQVKFAHARTYDLGDVQLIGSYHPSQRNTQTGFLTQAMFDEVFRTAVQHLDG